MAEDNDTGLADRHAQGLLAALGMRGRPAVEGLHPALAWRRTGLMAVTGHADGPALMLPAAVTAAADAALAALRAIAPGGALPPSGAALLGERTRRLGLRRGGRMSANGTCRLLTAADGSLALNLSRPDDWEALPALFQTAVAPDWSAVERVAAGAPLAGLVARGRELGLPIAPLCAIPTAPAPPFRIERLAPPRPAAGRPLVIDLSSLWAGPLAGALLAAAGADVVKVESAHRPDGARGGDGALFDLLNAGKRSVVLDFHDPCDLDLLRAMVARADIVIEASRPRALAQLGIDAHSVARGGATWLSLTAYGRYGDAAGWLGFGDDVAVAGGLAWAMAQGWGEPLFAGDALADPLTGIVAALAGWASWCAGGGVLVSVAMVDVVADALALYRPEAAELARWQALAEGDRAPMLPVRAAAGPAPAAGSSTEWARRTFSPG